MLIAISLATAPCGLVHLRTALRHWLVGWLVGWLVTGAPTFVIWHHSLIHIRDLAPLINIALVLVSSAKVKAGRCGVQSNQRVLPI